MALFYVGTYEKLRRSKADAIILTSSDVLEAPYEIFSRRASRNRNLVMSVTISAVKRAPNK